MRKTVYVILVLCCFIIKTYSINRPYYHFKQLSIKEGLPTSIISLYDDKNGSLWVGTTQGIYRFNGEKIKKYNLPYLLRKNSHYINDIFGDNEERIWAITSQGISYYEYEKDSLQIFLRHNQPVKASIITTEGSKLLIPVTDTLLVYEKELKHSKAIPLKTTGIHIIKMEPFDSTHYLIINNAWEIKLLNKHTGEITDSPFGESSNAYDLYKDSSGRYWVSFYGQGVKCYNQDGQLLTSYNTRNSNLSNDIVLDITEWDKAIWLATDGGGVNIIYPDTHDIQILSNKENRQFPANSVTCLCHSNNHMWIGMVREGVLGAEKGFITTYTKAAQNPASGLSDKCPLCLWEDKDGRIWIGTDGGGTYWYSSDGQEFSGSNAGGFSDFFEQMFGHRTRGGGGANAGFRGQDYHADLNLSLREAAKTHKQILTVNGKQVRITIPAGVANGQVIKLKGYGGEGINGGPAGDLYITFVIPDDSVFKRLGDDLYVDVTVDLYTALLGGDQLVDTLDGQVKLKVKPETQNGTKVRLKGKGFPVYKKEGQFGDLIVTYSVKLPTNLTEQQKEMFRKIQSMN